MIVFSLIGLPDGSAVPLEGKPPLRFAVLGDIHAGNLPVAESWTVSPVLQEILADLEQKAPCLILTCGDFIQGYTADETLLQRQHQAVQESLSQVSAPVFPCIGNHDVREPVSEAVWRGFWGPRYYAVDVGEFLFVVLDAELDKDVESIAGAQLDWLEKTLTEAGRKKKRVFVAGHRPYWKDYPLHKATWKGPGGRNDWTDQVEPLFHKCETQAVFVGHQHRFERERIGGLLHIITGGAGGDVSSYTPKEGGMVHYLWVETGEKNCSYSVMEPGRAAPVFSWTS